MRAFTVALLFVLGCQKPAPEYLTKAEAATNNQQQKKEMALELAALHAQGVYASFLAAHGRREWAFVEPQPPGTLLVHLVPVDQVVDMAALQQVADSLKTIMKFEPAEVTRIDVRIEPGQRSQPGNTEFPWQRPGRRRR